MWTGNVLGLTIGAGCPVNSSNNPFIGNALVDLPNRKCTTEFALYRGKLEFLLEVPSVVFVPNRFMYPCAFYAELLKNGRFPSLVGYDFTKFLKDLENAMGGVRRYRDVWIGHD